MNLKFCARKALKNGLLLALIFLAGTTGAQEKKSTDAVSKAEYTAMDATQRRLLFREWMNASRQTEVPAGIEEKAMAYCQANHIDARVYQKYKILFQTVSNESLPVSNRINACIFITENYDASIFPVSIVQDMLNDLSQKSK